MSDFDKEAERQRLREKYEKDAERREETQRMSELLLQGATMTNKHCNQCGTPIFRYQGTEFCPNCQHAQANAAAETADAAAAEVVDGEAGNAPSNGASEAATDESTGEAEQSVPTPEAQREVPAEVAGAGDAPNTDATNPRADESSGETDPVERAASAGPESGGVARGSSKRSPESTGRATETANATDASLREARESLLRAITEHARRSTATEEPQQAAAHLQAAREAAEALDALDR